jgi:hypothetical protein
MRPNFRTATIAACLSALATVAAAQDGTRPPPAAAAPTWLTFDEAVLQGLDKVTARVSAIEAPVGRAVRFGTLEITARTCRKRPPEETPESAAFLEIRDVKPGERPALIFSGWMFASSPALSALEHPVYDVGVIDCRNASSSPAPSSP